MSIKEIFKQEDILFSDQDFIVVNKKSFQPVVPDKTGDPSLLEDLIKSGLIEKSAAPVHRLDRPVRGVVLFARTARGLTEANRMLKGRFIKKTYLAVLENRPAEKSGTLKNHLLKSRSGNKSKILPEQGPDTREAILDYVIIGNTERYTMVRINLITGRHHQIRAQFSHIGCPIKGDIKYGSKRTNREGGIMLFAGSLSFTHPFNGSNLLIKAPLPEGALWGCFPDNVL
ncbi:MAG: RluA family pseudouridine synthase [Spirochaetales bacterium]|nr:RluA family pseudouridine synthase [Spirochaetales bacterium]